MKIKISNLANGTYDYLFEGNIDEIKITEPYCGKYKTEVVLTKFDNQMILDAETSIEANLVCDRCAIAFKKEISSRYRMVYLFESEIPDSEKDKTEVNYLHPDSEKIDISEDVKDYALLAVPMKKLCREDCKGLCYHCGKNLNEGECNYVVEKIDPRWEPLLKLKNK
ncbi:MAG: DUF177 domain-containing protein [Ignavibacteria bacterium]|nr:DUF177 domain-containing protein [Ignavibacteria bacterium]MBT8383059.1 DUF177 domain-containing protein [Ignavibacteria bacterium]MBT8392402.1 DUF177 domain-containing protein [Ignavibacteria bacterium]NNJ52653.1 DUF177 domain-containing protein [Ignavibacteriaceae bacterium]NNL22174.1 DUF177 domain-containing protein [Ignavibacteriaceae bacterium]